MRRRAFTLIEVIISLTLVSGCFAFTYQLIHYAKKKSARQKEKIERSLEHVALQSALVETLGQAHTSDRPLPILFKEDKGIGFVYENFADFNPDLCGKVYAAVALNQNRGSLELRLFQIGRDPKLRRPDKIVTLIRDVESWSIEELNLKKSSKWQKKTTLFIQDPAQAVRLSVTSKGEDFVFVINFQNGPPLNLILKGGA